MRQGEKADSMYAIKVRNQPDAGTPCVLNTLQHPECFDLLALPMCAYTGICALGSPSWPTMLGAVDVCSGQPQPDTQRTTGCPFVSTQEGVCAVFVDPHFQLDAPGTEGRVAEVDPKKVMQVGSTEGINTVCT